MNRTTTSVNITPSALWASAFVILALIVLQAGRMQPTMATADNVVAGELGFTLMTAPSGFGSKERPNELLYVIDNHTEVLYIYDIENYSKKRIDFMYSTSLPNLFRVARSG